MKEPKYKIGDEVWMMNGNVPKRLKIEEVHCNKTATSHWTDERLSYACIPVDTILTYDEPYEPPSLKNWWKRELIFSRENELFPTKQDLINSL